MRVFVLRHGDAVESTRFHDSQRPLSDVGRRQIRTIARFLHVSRIKPDLVFTSPLVRARETAQILQEILHLDAVLTTESLISGNNLRTLMEELNSQAVDSVMLVGHEPQLSGLISFLSGGDEQFRVEMKKAALACLETRHPVKKGHAVLTWLLTPNLLEKLL